MNTAQTPGEGPVRVLSLEVEAYKRIRAIGIRPDPAGNMVRITGENGQGKSSVLDAISFVLGGGTHTPGMPIHRGYKRAAVEIDFGEFVATKSATASGTALTVRMRDGSKIASPQAFLDKLIGNGLALEPLAFDRKPPREQVDTLKRAAGLDVSLAGIEAERAKVVEARTAASREIGAGENELKARPDIPGPDEEVSVEDLAGQVNAATKTARENADLRRLLADKERERDRARGDYDTADGLVQDLEAKLKKAVDNRQRCADRLQSLEAEISENRPRIEALQDPDVDAIGAEMRRVEAANKVARGRQERKAVLARVEAARGRYKAADQRINAIDAERERTLAEAKYPVEGLSFTEAGLMLGGVPYEQASTAERLRACVGICLAINKRVRVILVREGSLLDDKSLAELGRIAERYDAQVWVEEVTSGESVGIVIEDGSIVSVSEDAGAIGMRGDVRIGERTAPQ